MLSAEPVCSCAFSYPSFAHETAGAARTRHSLRPLSFGANDCSTARAHRAAATRSRVGQCGRSRCFIVRPIQPTDLARFFADRSASRETNPISLRWLVSPLMIAADEISGECKMAKMRAIDAAVRILEKEGVACAFGVPGRRDQSAVFRAEEARLDQPHPGAPRRGRLAHGGGLFARQGRQYRGLHRHIRAGRHRHDHRTLFGNRGLDPDPVHHRAGAARATLQGRFPGHRYRVRSPSR